MNALAGANVPFLFIVDYAQEQSHIEPLDRIDLYFRDSELFGNLADRLCGRGESLFQLENKDNRLSIEK